MTVQGAYWSVWQSFNEVYGFIINVMGFTSVVQLYGRTHLSEGSTHDLRTVVMGTDEAVAVDTGGCGC